MQPSLKTECSDLAIPTPTSSGLSQAQQYIFEKCILPSIKHRNHGKVATCCQCFFTREMTKQAFQYNQHCQIIGTQEFRTKFGINNDRDFAKYCQTLDIEPQIGGSRCTQPTIETQAKEISELKNRVQVTDEALENHKQRFQKVEDEAELLKKRVHALEELASQYERHVFETARRVCCDGFKYCIKCGTNTLEFHRKHLPSYKVFLKSGRQGIIPEKPGDSVAISTMTVFLEEYKAKNPTYLMLGDAAFDSITEYNRKEALEKRSKRW